MISSHIGNLLLAEKFHVLVRICEPRKRGDQTVTVDPSRVAIHYNGPVDTDGVEARVVGPVGVISTDEPSAYPAYHVRLGHECSARPHVLCAAAGGKETSFVYVSQGGQQLGELRADLVAGATLCVTVHALVFSSRFLDLDPHGNGAMYFPTRSMPGIPFKDEQVVCLSLGGVGYEYLLLGSCPVGRMFVPGVHVSYPESFNAIYGDDDRIRAALVVDQEKPTEVASGGKRDAGS